MGCPLNRFLPELLVLTGTPKLIDNHLEAAFHLSTGHEWQGPCAGCQRLKRLDEHVLGAEGLVCPRPAHG